MTSGADGWSNRFQIDTLLADTLRLEMRRSWMRCGQ